ncbi:large conductance mechanosensitive channel protein MscL [Streptomyces sp. NPDC096013]|uniref:large conductance mechanosensitive channel protein MscL n=1 Tax=Streptomyces sp. NPDC096013 TaxID=3366069 RepID=UPI0037F41688
MKGFRSFILRGNVVDLAVGIVIGAAFTAVVNGFVSAFLTPLVGLATGATGDMSRKAFTVGAIKFPYGAFINAAISFLLLAGALYFLVVPPVNKLHERLEQLAALPTVRSSGPQTVGGVSATRQATECRRSQPKPAGSRPTPSGRSRRWELRGHRIADGWVLGGRGSPPGEPTGP